MAQVLVSRLVVLGADGVPERHLPMGRDRIVLGRSSDSEVVLTDPQVSRHHAEIRHDHGRWVLRDLGSTHGTTRGGRRLESPVVLHHGDVIGLGPVRLRFEESAAEPPTVLPPPVPRSAPEAARSYRFDDNSVEGVQNNDVRQVLRERRSSLREVGARRTRARAFIWLGVVLLVVGIGTALVVISGFFADLRDAIGSSGAPSSPQDPFGIEVGGVPLMVIAAGIEITGLLMIVIGVVLHVVAKARRRDVDRRIPDPRLPRQR